MQRRQLLQAGTGLGLAPVAYLAAPATWAQPARAIVLGQSAALSGPASELGEQFRKGALLMFDRINARGGIAGRPIELVSLDDGYEPDRCVANTRRLIDARVFALFGYIGTPTSMVALPMAANAKLPFIAPFTGAQGLREPFNRDAFHVRASYYDETAAIVKQITSVGIRRIGVFFQDDSYGQAGLEGVSRALRPLGLEPVGLGKVARNTVDVGDAVRSILAGRPDAVVQISAYKSCAAFIRAARKAGFGGTFYNVSFVGTQALANELGPDAPGVVISQVMPFPFSAATPVSAEFLAAGQGAWNDAFTPNYSSMEGYVAAKTLVEGLRRAGSNLTPDGLMAGLESMRDVNLGGFFVDFSPQKHTASRFVDLTILSANGKVRRRAGPQVQAAPGPPPVGDKETWGGPAFPGAPAAAQWGRAAHTAAWAAGGGSSGNSPMDNVDLSVLRQVQGWHEAGHRVVLGTVTRTWGSAPRPIGSVVAVRGDGQIAGSVSGGCIEDDLIAKVRAGALAIELPQVVRYGVGAEEAARFGLPCGGTMELVFEPVAARTQIPALLERLTRGQRVRRVLALASGDVQLLPPEGSDELRLDADQLVTTHGPSYRLLVIGAGQLTQYLAGMARALDYEVIICDPRTEYADTWAVQGAQLLRSMPDDTVIALKPDGNTAVIALTHDPKLDDLALMEALRSDAFYVGAIGSRVNQAKRKSRLKEHFGLSDEQLARLHGPVGIKNGARTPPEIAVSILAELTAARYGYEIAVAQNAGAAGAEAGCVT